MEQLETDVLSPEIKIEDIQSLRLALKLGVKKKSHRVIQDKPADWWTYPLYRDVLFRVVVQYCIVEKMAITESGEITENVELSGVPLHRRRRATFHARKVSRVCFDRLYMLKCDQLLKGLESLNNWTLILKQFLANWTSFNSQTGFSEEQSAQVPIVEVRLLQSISKNMANVNTQKTLINFEATALSVSLIWKVNFFINPRDSTQHVLFRAS